MSGDNEAPGTGRKPENSPPETEFCEAPGLDREAEVDPRRMEVFIEAMSAPVPRHLRGLEREALGQGVPIIRPQTRELLRFFIAMKKPARILEVGTAVGFSALFMQAFAPAGCRITTIEKDAVRAEAARRNFDRAVYGSSDGSFNGSFNGSSDGPSDGSFDGLFDGSSGGHSPREKRQAPIELLEGDAAQILPRIREDASFDLIFMDAAKGQYIRYLPQVLRLLAPGGLLITDNILREGEILSSRFAVTRRNRTIHRRMRDYVRALMEEPSLDTLLVPNGDGAAVSVKRTTET